MNKVYSISDDDFIILVASSNNYSHILLRLGLVPKGGNSSKLLKRRITELGLSVEHFSLDKSLRHVKYNIDDILIENSPYANSSKLKKRLVSEGLLEYCCKQCGNLGEWLGNSITLQLDHINGIHNDNRIENLRFLCPNCHSQTETYSGKNKFLKNPSRL